MPFGWLRQWFPFWLRFRRHEDAYARNRDRLAGSIRKAIQRQRELGRPIWLITHSREIFEATQQQLQTWEYDYEIVMQSINIDRFVEEKFLAEGSANELLHPDSIKLILAALIPASDAVSTVQPISTRLAVMVLDRSENPDDDDRIETFCKNLPLQCDLGYFLSLEDFVVQLVLDENSLLVMEQLGLNRHDLITSQMLTTRLNRKLQRNRKSQSA